VRFTDAERYFVSSALPTTSKPSAFRGMSGWQLGEHRGPSIEHIRYPLRL
jgi:hypothetical protein